MRDIIYTIWLTGVVVIEKEYGGWCNKKKNMGVSVFPVYIAKMNMCHLATWIKRYNLDEDKLWKQIILLKSRVNNPSILSCSSCGALPFGKVFFGLLRL
jgi:hypothetical protein